MIYQIISSCNFPAVGGVPVLHFLFDKNITGAIHQLIQLGADPTVKNTKGENILHRVLDQFLYSSEKLPENEVYAIVDAVCSSPNFKQEVLSAKNADGKTPLIIALEVDRPWSKLILEKVNKSSPIYYSDQLNRTPLIVALDTVQRKAFSMILDAHYPELGNLFQEHFSNGDVPFNSQEAQRFVIDNLPEILEKQFENRNPLDLAMIFHSREIAQALYKEIPKDYEKILGEMRGNLPDDLLEFMEYPELNLGPEAYSSRRIPEAPEGVKLEELLEVFDRIEVVDKPGVLESYQISPDVLKGQNLKEYREKFEEVIDSVKNNVKIIASPDDDEERKVWYAQFEKALLHVIQGLKDEEKFDPVALITFAQDCMNCGDRWQTEILSFYDQIAGEVDESTLPQRAHGEMARFRRGIVQQMVPKHDEGSTHVYTKLINLLTDPAGLGITPIKDQYSDASTSINQEQAIRGFMGHDSPKARVVALLTWMNGLEADQKTYLIDSWLNETMSEDWGNEETDRIFSEVEELRKQQKSNREIVEFLKSQGLRILPYKGQSAAIPGNIQTQVNMIAKNMENEIAKLIEKRKSEGVQESVILKEIEESFKVEMHSLDVVDHRQEFVQKAVQRFGTRIPKEVDTDPTIEDAIEESLTIFRKQQYLDSKFRRENNGRLEYTEEAAVEVLLSAGEFERAG